MSVNALPGAVHRAGPKEWLGLAVLALPTLLLSLDITVLHLAVPHLSAALQPSSSQLLWIIDVYGFMIAAFLVTMGTLGDRIGRRKLLLVGAAAFGAASAVAAWSTTPEMLIASRTMMGIAGATLMPSTLSLISSMFRDPQQRGFAIGIWATMFSVGIAIGPVVGGVLLESFWWGSVFLLGVPVMLLMLATAPFLLPEYRDADAGRLDLPSVALALGTMLPITYGIKELSSHGLTAPAAGTIAVGVVLGVVFVRRQGRLAEPLLDLRLFAERRFRGALAVLLLSTALVGGIYLFITQYLQLVTGLSPMLAGLWLLPAAGALIIASLAAPMVARRVRPGTVVMGSLLVSVLGYVLIAQVGSVGGPALLIIGFVLVYVGAGATTSLLTDLVVAAAPPEKAGAASALSETSTELGVALGVAVLGSVGTAVYRRAVAGAVPAGVPAEAAEAAQHTLAEAAEATARVSGGVGDQLLVAASRAFTSGMNLAGWISAGIAAGLVVLAAATLRRTAPALAESPDRPSHDDLAGAGPH
jgi:MFS transporter, DHA2 family, multidrug resistance protein